MPTSKGLIKRDSTYISLNMTPEALVKAMRQHGLTATKVIKPIAEALEANKVVIVGSGDDAFADVHPDYQLRLKASAMAIELLKKAPSIPKDDESNTQALHKALKNMDEVELQRAVFRKDKTDNTDKVEQIKTVKNKV